MMSFQTKRKIVTIISFFIFFLSFLFFQQEANAGKKIWKVTLDNINQIKKRAEAGDGHYQAILGMAYKYELEESDRVRALEWLELAAANNNPIALYMTIRYPGLSGKPLSKSELKVIKSSIKRLKKLAKSGIPQAQMLLGLAYRIGRGVEKDYVKSREYLYAAAQQNYLEAMFQFGFTFEAGWGVSESVLSAIGWYEPAAELGHKQSMRQMASHYFRGAKYVKKDHSKAFKWWLNSGNKYRLWDMYYLHEKLKREESLQFIDFLKKQAEDGDNTSMWMLGSVYKKAKCGIKQDREKASKWLHLAAEDGNNDAQNELGEMYRNGNGVKQNYSEAAKWYKKAAEQGDSSAKKHLAELEVKLEEETKQAREAKLDKAYAALKAGFGQQAVKLFRKDSQDYGPLDSGLFRSTISENLIRHSDKPPLTALGGFALIAIAHADKTQTRLPIFWISNKEEKEIVKTIARSVRFEGDPLEVGDVLISMDGIAPGEGRWKSHLKGMTARTPVKIIFERNGVRHSTTVLTRAGYRGSQAGVVYFTLFEYGILAYHAGHLGITLSVAQQLQAMVDEAYVSPIAQPFIAVLEALVMVPTKGSDAALAHILDAGGLEVGVLAMYFEDYAPALWPLYKDRGKIAFLLSKDEGKIKWPNMKAPLPQPFPDLSGKLITPAAPPKLETKPQPAKPQTTIPPSQESREQDVMILD